MNQKKIKILTDSTGDMPKELYEKYDISIIPLTIQYNEKTYRDGIDIDAISLYKLMQDTNYIDHPKTSAISVGVFEQEIKKYIDLGYDEILFMGIGSCLSGTNRSFLIAGENYKDKIFLFDTGNLSSGISFSLLYAAQLKEKGFTSSEIISKLNERKNNYMVSFVVKNLDFLHKGGRCKGYAKVFAAALKVRPILRIDHDELYLYKKPAGKFQKALNILLEEMFQYYKNDEIDLEQPLFLTHSLCLKEEQYMLEQIKKVMNFKEIYITQTGTTIGTHCGPGTCGLVYALKHEYKRQ